MARPLVSILMGSDSDLSIMEEATKVLDSFGVPYEINVSSAHRTPERTANIVKSAEKRGVRVIIAGAGMAAHLAGFVAANTTIPVIGVPIDAGPLKGIDALLATVQMPGGVPVSTMAIGKAGAKNAGITAAQILSLGDKKLKARVKSFKRSQARAVEAKAKRLGSKLAGKS